MSPSTTTANPNPSNAVNFHATSMKLILPRLVLLFLSAVACTRANDTEVIAAARAADDERVAATIAADATRLNAIFSDQLHYAHSNGNIDTKASYADALVGHRLVYLSFEYLQREFIPIAPGAVLMKGRVLIKAGSPGQASLSELSFLAVWREEGGRWRFLAWQSCKNPPAAPAPPTEAKVNRTDK